MHILLITEKYIDNDQFVLSPEQMLGSKHGLTILAVARIAISGFAIGAGDAITREQDSGLHF